MDLAPLIHTPAGLDSSDSETVTEAILKTPVSITTGTFRGWIIEEGWGIKGYIVSSSCAANQLCPYAMCCLRNPTRPDVSDEIHLQTQAWKFASRRYSAVQKV